MKTKDKFLTVKFIMLLSTAVSVVAVLLTASVGPNRGSGLDLQHGMNYLSRSHDSILSLEDFLEDPEAMRDDGVSELVGINNEGRLVYGFDRECNRLSDFSFAGYRGGGIAIPDVPAVLTVYPGEGEDDTKRLQEAIDRVSSMPLDENGFRGALVLKKGRYMVTGTLTFHASGVVVRGEGAGFGGTWIYHRASVKDTTPLPLNHFPHIDDYDKGVIPTFQTRSSGRLQTQKLAEITQNLVPAGYSRFSVSDVSLLKPGDEVIVFIHHTRKWVNDLGLTWNPEQLTLQCPRVVKAVYPRTGEIELNVPVTSRIDRRIGYATAEVHGVIRDERLSNIGLEDIMFLSGYNRSRKDEAGYFNDENHPNIAFRLEGVVNGWMRRCTGFFYSKGLVDTGGSQHLTIEDCAMIDGVSLDTPARHAGSRKYYFNAKGDHILFQRCYGRYARHAFIGNGPRGGCVFLDCYSEKEHLKSEWHQKWGHGFLFDNVFGEIQIGLAGTTANAGHGQKCAFALAWNNVIRNTRRYEPDMFLNCIPGLVQNYAIGNVFWGGDLVDVDRSYGKIGHIESHNRFVNPRSLYLAQLGERLGEDAVGNIASINQLDGKRGAVWMDLVKNFSHFPEWADPEKAPWQGYEDWMPAWEDE